MSVPRKNPYLTTLHLIVLEKIPIVLGKIPIVLRKITNRRGKIRKAAGVGPAR
jgi:hypothetical protein